MGVSGSFSHVRMFASGDGEVHGNNVLEGDTKYEAEAQWLDPATNKWTPRHWSQLRVGDIVRVDKLQYFPADLLLLDAS
jgi:magnesium-transporting ATPase (P-type)